MDLVEFSFRLIDEVKVYPKIYSSKHFGNCKQHWKIISKNLGVDETLCRKRWKTLKWDYFRNVKLSWTKGPRPWQYMDRMKFLLPYGTPEMACGPNETYDSENDSSSNSNKPIKTETRSVAKSRQRRRKGNRDDSSDSEMNNCKNGDRDESSDKQETTDIFNDRDEKTETSRTKRRKLDDGENSTPPIINKLTHRSNKYSQTNCRQKSGPPGTQTPLEIFFKSFALQVEHFSDAQKLRLQVNCVRAAQQIQLEDENNYYVK